MSDIISKWLTNTLGIIVEVYSDTFSRLVQNGYLVGAVLRHYNIISADQLSGLTAAGDSESGLEKIVIWLKRVNIEVDNETKNALSKGKMSTALELFYKLYLEFQSKQPLYFMTKQVGKEKMRDPCDKFDVEPVGDETLLDIPSHPLSSALSEYKHIIQWYKDKYVQLLQRCEEARNNYAAFMERRRKVEKDIKINQLIAPKKTPSIIRINADDEKSLNEKYEELVEQEQRAQQMEFIGSDFKQSKQFMKELKKKLKKEQDENDFQSKMGLVVMNQFWDDLLKQQVKEMETDVGQKLLKQSHYEKEMASKKFERREQKDVITESRLVVLNQIQKKKEDELLESIFIKDQEATDDTYRYYFERDRALELHRRIYEEKQRLKAQRIQDMCENIVEDLLDFTICRAEYKEEFDEEMPKALLSDLAALFVNAQPIFDIVPNQEITMEIDPYAADTEVIYCEELNRQNILDKESFDNYCNYEGRWELEEHLPSALESNSLYDIQLAMNILGHILFRLLLTKYPKPASKPPPNIPKYQIAVCISNIVDVSAISTLGKLVSERQVKILQMEDAINFCLAAYKDETTVDCPESQFVDEIASVTTKISTKKKGKAEVKQNKKKKDEKKNGRKKSPRVIENQRFLEQPDFKDKQIQTPRIYPSEEIVLSPAAELGRLAKEIHDKGEDLNDILLVKIFVEYLKTLKDIYGWVLINYPTTFEQVKLLEEALTSKPVPQNIDEAIQNDSKSQEKYSESFDIKENVSSQSYGLAKLFASNDEVASPDDKNSQTNCQNNAEELKDDSNDGVKELADLDFRPAGQNHIAPDNNAQFRVSRILTNPDPPISVDDYYTYLTAFIRLVLNTQSQPDLGTDSVPEYELDDLDKFYQNQGCLYSLYYKVLDMTTIKHIGKLIIGDYSLPPKASVEIFGDTILYLEKDMDQDKANSGKMSKSKSSEKKKPKKEKPVKKVKNKDDDIEKPKKDKKDKKAQGDKKSSASKDKKKKDKKSELKEGNEEEPVVVIIKNDKETQMPELPPEEEEVLAPTDPKPMPGQYQWKYSDLPIPDFFQIALATLWENIEEIYVVDFSELFFRRRILWKAIMPYLNFVKDYMRDYISRPDDKQVHLHNFQFLYNKIDADMRNDDEVKGELQCRIFEFREKLWQICDVRMSEAEDERKGIISQDRMAKQVCEITNVYITAMQLEIDRCVDTLQLLNDYYVAMITKTTCEEKVFEKKILDYIELKDNFEFEDYTLYSNFVRHNMTNINEIPNSSPYHEIIQRNCNNASSSADDYLKQSLNIIATMEAFFQPKSVKNKTEKKEVTVKGKTKLPKFTIPDPEIKDVGLKLIEEWRTAVNGEFARVVLRLKLVEAVSSVDISNVLSASVKTFHEVFTEIKERYDKEMSSVEECCEVLLRAVEEEISIQPELILKGDTFYIIPNILLFPEPLQKPEPEINEYQKPESFTIAQLSLLTDILFNLAPSGIMPERSFMFLLQDMIVNNSEEGNPSLVPLPWRKISQKNLNKLTYEFFGQVELVDWKDFIINNLCVEFPNEFELMDIRRQFRDLDVDAKEIVYDYQFRNVKFWFEKEFNLEDPCEELRLREMKELLFKLYRLNEEMVNYTALLLAFCKDNELFLGIAKALQLSTGKYICWDPIIGETFLENLRQRKFEKLQEKLRIEKEEAEKLEIVDEVVDDLIDVTVRQCDSCYLESWGSHSSKDEIMDQELIYLESIVKDYETGYEYSAYGENLPAYLFQEFSNVEIGFEPEYYPSKVYYLSLELLATVMLAAMPWQAVSRSPNDNSFRKSLENAYNSCKDSEFDEAVFMHLFLHSEQLKQLLKNNFKFIVRKPSQIVSKLLEDL